MIDCGTFYFTTGFSVRLRSSLRNDTMLDAWIFGDGEHKTTIPLREEDLDKLIAGLIGALAAMQEVESD